MIGERCIFCVYISNSKGKNLPLCKMTDPVSDAKGFDWPDNTGKIDPRIKGRGLETPDQFTEFIRDQRALFGDADMSQEDFELFCMLPLNNQQKLGLLKRLKQGVDRPTAMAETLAPVFKKSKEEQREECR